MQNLFLLYMYSRVECGQNRSGMILEVQIQNFGARRAQVHAGQSFHFQKIPGAQILIFFCENWHEASFYIKEQRQRTNSKFEF